MVYFTFLGESGYNTFNEIYITQITGMGVEHMRRAMALILELVFLTASLGAAAPDTLSLAPPVEGWADSYISFLDGNYDIFAALWPDGIGGIAFMDLDLDGTPEMLVFDQGASISMGAHLFDLIDGTVQCVSSTLDSASGAFGGGYLSAVHVNAGFFEAFRLGRTEAGWCFWVDSNNGTMETAWDEIVRFDSAGGVLTPVSICDRYLEFDPSSGLVTVERYTVGGAETDNVGYDKASLAYQESQDAGYEAKGVYVWDDPAYADGPGGLLTMARDAAAAYVPIPQTVTLASVTG